MTTRLVEVGLACLLLGGVSFGQVGGPPPTPASQPIPLVGMAPCTGTPEAHPAPTTPTQPDIETEALAAYGRLTSGDVPALEEAATASDPEALFLLGRAHLEGRFVPQDVSKGLALSRRSAVLGYRPAEVALGDLYAGGSLVTHDEAEAVRWYLRAAHQGCPEAQRLVAAAYAIGAGVPRDHSDAMRWYLRAAEGGHAVAMCDLGDLYVRGQGVLRSDRDGYRWYVSSVAAGYAACERGARETAARLSPEERAAAERAAREWAARSSS